MKITVISTTINVPELFRLHRTIAPNVEIIIVGDRKTPHAPLYKICEEIGNARYLSDADQEALGYKSSPIIGWNKIMRRNIALLEAIKGKADIIITVDDDNIPVSPSYFDEFEALFAKPFNGLAATSPSNLFDTGQYLQPPVHHRGFPYSMRHQDLGVVLSPAINAKVGVAAGLWLGDPDIDATTRIVNRPMIYHMSDVMDHGVVVKPGTYSPYNSQNTAFLGELAPLMLMWAGMGRYDDIWASYFTERFMLETGHHVHFGRPYVYQERNVQNPFRNLKDELYGIEHTDRFLKDLADTPIRGSHIVEQMRYFYEDIQKWDYVPDMSKQLGLAWCDDLEKIL